MLTLATAHLCNSSSQSILCAVYNRSDLPTCIRARVCGGGEGVCVHVYVCLCVCVCVDV